MKIFGIMFTVVLVILGALGYTALYGERVIDTITFTYEVRGIHRTETHNERDWNRPASFLNAWRYTALHNDNAAASGGRAAKIVDIQYCTHKKPCVSWMLEGLRS